MDNEWVNYYRSSGILLIVGLVAAFSNINIFAAGPAPGSSLEDALTYDTKNQLIFWVGNGIFGAAFFLLVPA